MTNYGRNGPFPPGARVLEQYEVVRLLGTGGHAYVYECRDLFLDEHLAVKVIPNPPNRGRDLLNRARAEAQLLRRLSHPNVVRMHTAAALADDMVCLVMEKLDGISLRHLLTLLGRLSVVEAATVVRQIAVGVAAAHELNVVHRDIKPDNAFVLPPNNHVKVLDFGIAKFLGHGLQTSNKYRFQGTPLYMSPEHLKGAGVTVRSDVYQLGTVLFELIAGINPNLIDLDNPGFEQVAFVQITRPTPSLRRVLPNALDALDQLIQRATAKEPEARFATMADFVAALDQTLHAHVADHPEDLSQIRYVDESLMQAAKELAAQEQSNAWDGQSDASPPAQHRIDSTMSIDTAPTEPLSALPATDRLASFHPVPQLPGPDTSPFARSSQARIVGTKARESAKASAPRRSQSISALFVIAALGFGVAIGCLVIWLVPRKSATAQTAPSNTAIIAASAVPSTPLTLAASAASVAPTAPASLRVPPTPAIRTGGAKGASAASTPMVEFAPPAPPTEPQSAPVASEANPEPTGTQGEKRRIMTGDLDRATAQ